MCKKVRTAVDRSIVRSYSNSSSVSSVQCVAVMHKEYGDPTKVLSLETTTLHLDALNVPGSKQVLLKILAAPVNPADINTIQGVYPIKPVFPAVGGTEGVMEVTTTGRGVTDLKQGDWVVPLKSAFGTWRSHAICDSSDLMVIPKDIPVLSAATLAVNPCTAYRMLKDFENLQAGDVVIQSGGNSAVGQALIQIAKDLGVQTVSIIRNKPDVQELEHSLKQLGANHVITDDFVRTKEMKEFMRTLPKPKLAVDCVGGKTSAELLKYLNPGGTLVSYGGMSKQPMMVPVGSMIFQDVKVRGYWMTRWRDTNINNPEARSEMWEYLCSLVRQGKLETPNCRQVEIAEYYSAIAKAMEPYANEKQILVP